MVKWSPKPEVGLVLPVASDLTAPSAAWASEAEPQAPVVPGFHGKNPTLGH